MVSVAVVLALTGLSMSVPANAALRVQIRLSTDAATGIAALGLAVPVTGRVFLILSRDASTEPRLQIGVTGVPLWGMDVRGFGDNDAVTLDTSGARLSGTMSEGGVIGYPLASFDAIPPWRIRRSAVPERVHATRTPRRTRC